MLVLITTVLVILLVHDTNGALQLPVPILLNSGLALNMSTAIKGLFDSSGFSFRATTTHDESTNTSVLADLHNVRCSSLSTPHPECATGRTIWPNRLYNFESAQTLGHPFGTFPSESSCAFHASTETIGFSAGDCRMDETRTVLTSCSLSFVFYEYDALVASCSIEITPLEDVVVFGRLFPTNGRVWEGWIQSGTGALQETANSPVSVIWGSTFAPCASYTFFPAYRGP